MWTPRSFRVEDIRRLHDLVRSYPFGLLVSEDGGRLVGTHLPFMIESSGVQGTLLGHMARANPHWRSWSDESEVLAVFQGPHAYISPGWYRERVTVPTWNYAAVHAYGRPSLVHDPAQLRDMVTRLTRLYEPETGNWSPDEAEPVMDTELQAIVGFRIPIDRIEGKFKFNQNRSRSDQAGVVAALEGSEDPSRRGVAAIMRENLSRDPPTSGTDDPDSRRPEGTGGG